MSAMPSEYDVSENKSSSGARTTVGTAARRSLPRKMSFILKKYVKPVIGLSIAKGNAPEKHEVQRCGYEAANYGLKNVLVSKEAFLGRGVQHPSSIS
jgi:hypothetical protein